MTRDKIDFNGRLLEISSLANQLKKSANPAADDIRSLLNIAAFMRIVDFDEMLKSGLLRPVHTSGVHRHKSGVVCVNSVSFGDHSATMSHVVKRTRAIRHLFNNPKQQTDHELVKNGTYGAVIERARYLNMDV